MPSSRFVTDSTPSPKLAPPPSCSRADRCATPKSLPPRMNAASQWCSPGAGISGTDQLSDISDQTSLTNLSFSSVHVSEFSRQTLSKPSFSRRLVLVVLLCLAVCPYFVDLSGSSIWDANEAFYVETPREMMERGDYIGPTFNYQPRFNKPVLSYWIVAGFYKAFGISVGVQRIPIALGAVAMILTAFFLARSGAVPPNGSPNFKSESREPALGAAVGSAVAPGLMLSGRRIFIDIYISMFMAGTLLFFALAE